MTIADRCIAHTVAQLRQPNRAQVTDLEHIKLLRQKYFVSDPLAIDKLTGGPKLAMCMFQSGLLKVFLEGHSKRCC